MILTMVVRQCGDYGGWTDTDRENARLIWRYDGQGIRSTLRSTQNHARSPLRSDCGCDWPGPHTCASLWTNTADLKKSLHENRTHTRGWATHLSARLNRYWPDHSSPGNCPCFALTFPIHDSFSFLVLITVSRASPTVKSKPPPAWASSS